MEINYNFIKEANRQYHNKHASQYDEFTMRGNFSRVEPMFKKHSGGAFLDLGCGTGEQLKIAKKYFDEVYGIDCSEGMVNIAKKVTGNVVLGDVGSVPFLSKFDFINCYSVLHHLYEQGPFIKEVYRLLKPGGVFYSDNDSNRNFYRIFKGWLLFRRHFLRKKNQILSLEMKELEKLAEYHSKGLNAEELAWQFRRVGFSFVNVEYHYPDKPDLFTKALIFTNQFLGAKSLFYYFSLTAVK